MNSVRFLHRVRRDINHTVKVKTVLCCRGLCLPSTTRSHHPPHSCWCQLWTPMLQSHLFLSPLSYQVSLHYLATSPHLLPTSTVTNQHLIKLTPHSLRAIYGLAHGMNAITFCCSQGALAHSLTLLRVLVLTELSETSRNPGNSLEGQGKQPYSQWEFCLFFHTHKSDQLTPLGEGTFLSQENIGWNVRLTNLHLVSEYTGVVQRYI